MNALGCSQTPTDALLATMSESMRLNQAAGRELIDQDQRAVLTRVDRDGRRRPYVVPKWYPKQS